MANMRSVPTKGSTYFIYEGKVASFGKGLFLGVNLAGAPKDQIWVSNEIFVNKKESDVKKRIDQIKAKGRINLMDDFDILSGNLAMVATFK